ncbi:MAG: CRISPR-associated protein Csx20 [Desulfobulbaceae bacterium]|nr:CRISPR-associated protein Csx20 [Desulfobulbaceae bacterium]
MPKNTKNHPASPALFLLFNHRLTRVQETDARASLGIRQIVAPPEAVQHLWSAVPPEAESLGEYLAPVVAWLAAQARPGDFVLIQGEFGATCALVSEAFRLGLAPVYSTTRREAVEEHDADNGRVHIRHTFSHVRYRKYEP